MRLESLCVAGQQDNFWQTDCGIYQASSVWCIGKCPEKFGKIYETTTEAVTLDNKKYLLSAVNVDFSLWLSEIDSQMLPA